MRLRQQSRQAMMAAGSRAGQWGAEGRKGQILDIFIRRQSPKNC